jgi:hypothetical protein
MRVSRPVLLALVCGLAACRQPAPAPATDATTASATTAGVEAAPMLAPAQAPSAPAPSLAPPPSDAPTDEFVGWYFEKGGTGMLVGCGQSMPLEVTDPAFLHQLNARRGGSTAPVYVRLDVRPGSGSRLEVARIQQFGVDEGPAPDCALGLAP